MIKTPIDSFVRAYRESGTARLHMPGHKGIGDIEGLDITEIRGADSLYEADGIIMESEAVASSLFGAHSFYSTEGSSLAIRAMLYLAVKNAGISGKRPFILAARNAHRVFVSAAALLDFDYDWIYPEDSYLSCRVTPEALEKRLDEIPEDVTALYLTSPDYLGITQDIEPISRICKRRGILLLVDNAHGAYLKFLTPSRHPIDLGADMCADSAHKTLPTLTGGAYLHISKRLPGEYKSGAKLALSLFGSTSPSYLILASLDRTNRFIGEELPRILPTFVDKLSAIKANLEKNGFTLIGDEPLKITLFAKSCGYTGNELADLLREAGVECEFSDPDYLTLMLSPIDASAAEKAEAALLGAERKAPLSEAAPLPERPERACTIREATLARSERLPLGECIGRVLAAADAACPPAVPILMPGEIISDKLIRILRYYGKEQLYVIKNPIHK